MRALPPGLHPDIAPERYHSRELGVASKSALDLVRRSLAHYRAWVDGAEAESTPALAFGSAFHCAALEPERFGREYAVEPAFGDCRLKAQRAERDAWRESHNGVALLSEQDAAAIEGMCRALAAHPLASKMMRDGVAELTLRWQDESGIACKGRVDWYVEALRAAVDLKSTSDASATGFRRSVAQYGYHRQDAFYRSGFAAAGSPIEHFVFIAVEKTKPHAVALYTLDESAVARGHAGIRVSLEALAGALDLDEWPGYPARIQELDLPRWAE